MYQVGTHFQALIEGVLMAPLNCRYIQVGFNLISVQVCKSHKGLTSKMLPEPGNLSNVNVVRQEMHNAMGVTLSPTFRPHCSNLEVRLGKTF